MMLALAGNQSRLRSMGVRIAQQRLQAFAIQVAGRIELGQRSQGRVDVDQAHCPARNGTLGGHAWSGQDQRNSGRFLPEGALVILLLLSDVVAMIGEEHDDGVVRVRTRPEGS